MTNPAAPHTLDLRRAAPGRARDGAGVSMTNSAAPHTLDLRRAPPAAPATEPACR